MKENNKLEPQDYVIKKQGLIRSGEYSEFLKRNEGNVVVDDVENNRFIAILPSQKFIDGEIIDNSEEYLQQAKKAQIEDNKQKAQEAILANASYQDQLNLIFQALTQMTQSTTKNSTNELSDSIVEFMRKQNAINQKIFILEKNIEKAKTIEEVKENAFEYEEEK